MSNDKHKRSRKLVAFVGEDSVGQELGSSVSEVFDGGVEKLSSKESTFKAF